MYIVQHTLALLPQLSLLPAADVLNGAEVTSGRRQRTAVLVNLTLQQQTTTCRRRRNMQKHDECTAINNIPRKTRTAPVSK